ncbi:MAG: tRNA-dihydrouridine synthase [Patescibacteria group bacterium]|nr:tRNA-dihydrouridine synthase [Patescibacteria group bacterium]
MGNFWQKLKKPIFCLAPMAGITDAAFRYLCGKFGADVVYSEMVSAAGLFFDSERTSGLLDSYKKNGGAKFVVQLFGNNPEHFAKAVKIVEQKIKPDGIDINFGCPVAKIVKSGAGTALFKDLEQSRRVLEAVLKNTKLPVSVKARISTHPVSARGGSTPPKRGISIFDFVEKMKGLDIAAIMVHGRTLAQGFAGEIDYGAINRLKKIFSGVIIANGGINTPEDAEIMLKKTNADGVGIAQGSCGHPQIFEEIKNPPSLKLRRTSKKGINNIPSPSRAARATPPEEGIVFKIAYEHAKLMEKLKGKRGILEMRKHLCWYVKGMPDAAEMRKELVKVETLADIKKLLK